MISASSMASLPPGPADVLPEPGTTGITLALPGYSRRLPAEYLVQQEAAVGPEGLYYVPAVTRAEGTAALEEDVVQRMPEAVGQRGVPPPGEGAVDTFQVPQAHRGCDTGEGRVLHPLPETPV